MPDLFSRQKTVLAILAHKKEKIVYNEMERILALRKARKN